MNIVCLEEPAFYKLIEEVVNRIKVTEKIVSDRWISGEEAMRRLRINSKTTLQKLRDNGAIRFSQPEKKIILYDALSIDNYLEKHAKEPF